MIYEICKRCKWYESNDSTKCHSCKNNMLTKQDYYTPSDGLAEKANKALKEDSVSKLDIPPCAYCKTHPCDKETSIGCKDFIPLTDKQSVK